MICLVFIRNDAFLNDRECGHRSSFISIIMRSSFAVPHSLAAYASAKLLRLKCFEILFSNISWGIFTREPYHCPFRGNDEYAHSLRYAYTIWTQLVISSRERQVLRSPITRCLTHIIISLISRLVDNDVVGSSVFPTHFGPMGFWGNSRVLTVPTSQTLVSGIRRETGSVT